ncbi:hypothetical protein Ocin01_11183 [Orchesella cincta]|uniref:Spaetzle domain-containing protein n=1 Tax=Orchesella cincta TaxID=48709 RepID=A0A1D2MRQ0_ORCCI|nr:hypothetical protein Ocin01_11183 [Orchesella cincta]
MILWTALSYALGLEIRGEILRGLPCIKRLNQLFCPTAGTTYPLNNIERFIDENKALIKRMYGEFIMNSEAYVGPVGSNTLRRSTRDVFEHEVPDLLPSPHSKKKRSAHAHHQADHDANPTALHNLPDDFDDHLQGNGTVSSHVRSTRQTVNNRNGGPTQQPKSNRLDSCESTVEIVTPYWAANSGGKVRAIVNTQHFEQAIHQEVCTKTSTKRCFGECGCEQKYKWHRLLAYDPDNDCRGIFMDWFLFPSCCVCRCNP